MGRDRRQHGDRHLQGLRGRFRPGALPCRRRPDPRRRLRGQHRQGLREGRVGQRPVPRRGSPRVLPRLAVDERGEGPRRLPGWSLGRGRLPRGDPPGGGYLPDPRLPERGRRQERRQAGRPGSQRLVRGRRSGRDPRLLFSGGRERHGGHRRPRGEPQAQRERQFLAEENAPGDLAERALHADPGRMADGRARRLGRRRRRDEGADRGDRREDPLQPESALRSQSGGCTTASRHPAAR